ncbi:MAG: pyridoxamine 5'-phosphate oxidase family protein [Spirochaetes bacterium]|nr:pyridoxamine 5'-phosphate oxidase family protein [Spirochaetota bacterium]
MTAQRQAFNDDEIRKLEPTEKVALVATVNPEGLPHVSLLTSLQPIAPGKMVLGEFSRGLSKEFMQRNNRVGFLVMTLDRALWRGAARWTHFMKEGPEYRMMNEKPMFRYNAYFGVNTVHYFDLVRVSEREGLPLGSIALAMAGTAFARGGMRRIIAPILKPFALSLIDRVGSLTFLAYVAGDGYPVIIPILQCRAADSGRLAFSMGPYGGELAAVPVGSTVAVYAMTMQMENILIRGVYNGPRRCRGVRLGSVDITWAYNSMPPVHGQIYPEKELPPVSGF